MSKLIETIVEAIDDKKGKDIVSLDLTGFDGAITDAFVVCGADSTTQVAAIAAHVEEQVQKQLGEKVTRIEGLQNSLWVVMDYGDVMVHIFQTPLRDFYKLEQLWADAPTMRYHQENQ
ncbi:MAG: ribosome silencing factor [Rikenellaceae bacterium]|jgi:ribosome-associated protein|nr:ribosome silencing factor [Rikenellaceae bacterium]